MSLLTIVLVLIVAGVGLYLVNAVIPMDPTIKKVLNIVVVAVLCLWVVFSVLGHGTTGIGGVSVPRIC